MDTTDSELNRVLGGGVPGSLILLGGEPGIGKNAYFKFH
jgi:DNA repair protein RadA/Sms